MPPPIMTTSAEDLTSHQFNVTKCEIGALQGRLAAIVLQKAADTWLRPR
jgi:hypothetical protein